MDVTVVIVNWNTKDLILKCIRSIINTKSEYSQEIIVVDNASSDGSVEAIIKEYPNVIIELNEMNLGFAKANNIGIERSQGRYLCLVNSDVEVLPLSIEYITDYMDNNPKVGIVGPKILFPDRALQNSCRKYPTLWTKFCEAFALNRIFPKSTIFSGEHMEYFSHDRIINVESLAGCFMMVRHAALIETGKFDEQYFIYSEETDLCRRFTSAGWDIIFLPVVSVIHHHAASSSRDPVRFAIEQQRSLLKYWRKHHSRLSAACLFAILLFNNSIRYVSRYLMYTVAPTMKESAESRIEQNRECIKALFCDQKIS